MSDEGCFHRPPKPETLEEWKQRVASFLLRCDFCQGPKVPCACGERFCYCNLMAHLGHSEEERCRT